MLQLNMVNSLILYNANADLLVEFGPSLGEAIEVKTYRANV